jgi:hypothetical protein
MTAISQQLPFAIARRVKNERRLSEMAEDAFYGDIGGVSG